MEVAGVTGLTRRNKINALRSQTDLSAHIADKGFSGTLTNRRSPPEKQTAAPGGDGRGGNSKADRLAVATFFKDTRPAKPGQRPWHAGAPNRRRKTEAELIADGAYWELLDRRFPGRFAAGSLPRP